MNKAILIRVVYPVVIFIIGLWIGGWFLSFSPEFQQLTGQPINDIFNSLNALFAGLAFLGVIVTVYFQIEELKDTREELARTSEANQRMAEDSKSKSVLELYQTFCSPYFQEIKSASMRVLIACIKNKQYCDFVISRFFVARQLNLPEGLQSEILSIFNAHDYDDFRDKESIDRYKLDELINFFSILTFRNDQENIVRQCDFFYPWWRPLFWLIALLQEQRYMTFDDVREFNTELYFPDVVAKLDKIYGFTPIGDIDELWVFLSSHPKINTYGLDQSHVNHD